MFMGNLDDDGVVRNNLEYPIVARYICINPQRWHQFISLRREMYGCRFGKIYFIIHIRIDSPKLK